MPSFLVALEQRVIDPDPAGPLRRLQRACTHLFVQTGSGEFAEFREFIIDTGATYTLMSATLARSRGIVFPPETSRLGMVTAVGQRSGRVHDGELRVRFPQLPDHLFRLYCVFAEEVPPSVPPVLGLNDTLDVFRLAFDGSPVADAPFGGVRFDTRP